MIPESRHVLIDATERRVLLGVLASFQLSELESFVERLRSEFEIDDNDQWFIEQAQDTRHRDGETEIDDNAVVSYGADDGAYVQAWVWVRDDRASVDEEG